MIFLGPNKTETMFMIFIGIKHCYTDTSEFAGEAILTSICIVLGYFMFMYGFLNVK